jgi:hypothetical protein
MHNKSQQFAVTLKRHSQMSSVVKCRNHER